MTHIVAMLVVLTILGGLRVAWAEDGTPATNAPTSHRIAAGIATVLYTPLKAGLCVIGGGASGFAYLNAGPRAAKAVAGRSCNGTWVLTADHLEGKQPLEFVHDSIRFPED
ncbi:MAG: hypothetical protein C5B48_12365 [Candidatus Rokuibacteriota bacterium]|nr:MAG: hypothetical protein C5B48_12365 [Candidatus Rokubacteria bacterium]